jgi:transcription-repair coupling factor (superfamily II helicase)
MRLKIDIYRRLTRVSNETELADLIAELNDRFGPPPETAQRLLSLAQMRLWAHHWRIASIHLEDGFAVLGYTSRKKIQELAARPPRRLRVVDERSAYLPLDPKLADPDGIAGQIKSLLQPS